MIKSLQIACRGIILFFICVIYSSVSDAQTGVVDIGKSFANISKLSTGGTFQPNDTLEVRVTFAVRNVAPSQITAVQVLDTVPAKTTYVPNSLRTTTNEGITYKTFTDVVDADPCSSVAGIVLMNLGTGATKVAGGTIKNTDKPSFYGTTCIIMACYRVIITSTDNYGDTLKFGGKAIYKVSGTTFTVNFPLYQILLSQSVAAACSNGLATSAAGDSLGTFASGIIQNRATPLAFTTTYTKANIGTGQPQDYSYAITNNSSADGSTNPNSTMPEATALHRVFGLWDIAGDHTGATNTAFGNPPTTPGSRGGYMVLINSSYNTDTAYKETLSGLCANSYYQFSAWFRNLCPRCGCDSTGKGSGTTGYIPGPGNDSSGVKPNINFQIDGLAIYTSGDIKYDRTAPWKKFGFVFLTKPAQTTASFLIRNNSPGGGGNDWALDDITVSHCGPTLSMNITPIVLGCDAAPFLVSLSDTVRYLYNNSYIYFQWQKSNVGGTIWANMTGPGTSGVGTPVLVNGQYQYVTNLPPFLAVKADSGTYYRVIVATTAGNLTNTCAYNDGTQTMISVIKCGVVLAANFTQFNGKLVSRKAFLNWSAFNEQNLSRYEIEKSTDGINFSRIGAEDALNILDASYNFTDPVDVNGNTYYRLKMIDQNGLYKYSSIVLISSGLSFAVNNLLNPIKNVINVDVIAPKEGPLNLTIYNSTGQFVKTIQLTMLKGLNNLVIDHIDIPNGIYILSIGFDNEFIKRKLVKIN